jgi:hypothetical protein
MALALAGVHAQNNLPALAGKSLNTSNFLSFPNNRLLFNPYKYYTHFFGHSYIVRIPRTHIKGLLLFSFIVGNIYLGGQIGVSGTVGHSHCDEVCAAD